MHLVSSRAASFPDSRGEDIPDSITSDGGKEAEDDPPHVSGVASDLRNWIVNNNIPRVAVDELLEVFAGRIPELPRSCRTLLGTPLCTPTVTMPNGDYVHFGLGAQLRSRLEACNLVRQCTLQVSLNVDELPLLKLVA